MRWSPLVPHCNFPLHLQAEVLYLRSLQLLCTVLVAGANSPFCTVVRPVQGFNLKWMRGVLLCCLSSLVRNYITKGTW